MENGINKIRNKLENLYLRFGVENNEVIKLSKELDEMIVKIQYKELEEYIKNN